MITWELHAWNLRVKNTRENAHKFSETACKIVHIDCMYLKIFIFGWNLWSDAQWCLAVELYKNTLNICHILGKNQTDCFSHQAAAKLLSIWLWNATYTRYIAHLGYLFFLVRKTVAWKYTCFLHAPCCKGFFHKRDVHARMTEIPYCWSKSLFTALIWKSWGCKRK